MKKLRLGFAGAGWIGSARLRSIAETSFAQPCAIFDIDPEQRKLACGLATGAKEVSTFDALLDSRLDGLVVATPNFLHEPQALAALERGIPVFCQKPLALDAAGTRRIVDAARMNNRLLAVDFCYRYTAAISAMKRLLLNKELGEVYSAELAFHNAYGPDRKWYYDTSHSGGGCVIDLGTHLVDLALWLLGDFEIMDLTARLHRPAGDPSAAEDYAAVQFNTSGGVAVTIVCSWRLATAGDAHIFAGFYGTNGGLEFRNLNGSFYDFQATHTRDGRTRTLASPPDDWGGRAILDWACSLRSGAGFDAAANHFVEVAEVIDRIYQQ